MKKLKLVLWSLALLACCAALFFGCDEAQTGEEGSACAQGHTYGELVVEKEPTCLEQGEGYVCCAVCEKTATQEIPALGHAAGDWVVETTVGCSTEGVQRKFCMRCNLEMDQLYTTPTGHTIGQWQVDVQPGCESEGRRYRPCLNCDKELVSEKIKPSGHTEGRREIALAATCTTQGLEKIYCADCPKCIGVVSLPTTNHTWEWREILAASCTRNGQEQQYCTAQGCEATGDVRSTSNGDHVEGEWTVDVQGDCTNEGYRYLSCSDCGEKLREEYFYDEDHHRSSGWVVDVEALCERDGSRYTYCLDCNEELVREVIPAAHKEGSWTEVTAADCLNDGTECKYCSVCSDLLDQRAIPALGHAEGGWVVDSAPGCLTTGSQHRVCSTCTQTVETAIIPATGHSTPAAWDVIDAATCTDDGVKVKCCTTCTTELQREIIPATGHSSGVWVELDSTDSLPSAYMKLCCPTCNAVLNGKSKVGKEQVVITGGSNVSVDLSKYKKVIYPAGASALHVQRAQQLASLLSALTGQTVSAVADNKATTTYEILLGRVDRSAASDAYKDISGHGYTVQYRSNKIVITGTNPIIAFWGLDYFENTYLKGSETTVTMPQKATSDKYRTAMLVNASGAVEYTPIYDQHLDTDDSVPTGSAASSETYYGVVGGNVSGSTGVDYAYDATLAIRDYLVQISSGDALSVYSDARTPSSKELLVGIPDRAQVVQALSLLQGHEYGIFVYEDRVIVTGYSTLALQKAVSIFIEYLADAVCADGSVVLPQNLCIKGSASNEWFVDAPQPDGLTLYNTADGGDGALQYLYMGNGVNKSAFDAYCQKLEAAGYVVVTQSNAEGSYFVTYERKADHTMVHVSFDAYTHASGSNFAYASPSIRIITSYTNRVSTMLTVPTAEMLNPNQSYEKITDSAIVAVSLHGTVTIDGRELKDANGTGYVILLEDGTFIVIDGGASAGSNGNLSTSWYEVDNMWKILSTLYQKVYGHAPTREDPVRIRAWVISHSHGDHIGVLWDFTHRYGVGTNCSTSTCSCTQAQGRGAVQIDYLLTNVPAQSELYNTGEANLEMRTQQAKLRRYLTGSETDNTFTYVKVQTGQKLYFANAEIEVLFTHNDLNPQRIVTFNDTSSVMRFTFTPTQDGEKVDAGKTSFLFTGDAYMHSGRWMCAMYGDYLKSDMVTLAHHGGPGVEAAFYQKVQARVLWVPNTTANSNGWMTTSAATWIKTANRTAATLSSVKYVICANYYNMTNRNITVDLTVSGPDLDNAYYTGASGSVVYGAVNSKGQLAYYSTSSSGSSNIDIGKR